MRLCVRTAQVLGARAQQHDAWLACVTGDLHVVIVIDGVGDRPDAAAAGLRGASEAISLLAAHSIRVTPLLVLSAIDAAYRGPLASFRGETPAAAAVVAVVDACTGEFGLAWLGDVIAFIGATDGETALLTRPHNGACDALAPGAAANALTRFVGDPSPAPLPPETFEGRLHTGEALLLASDGVIHSVLERGDVGLHWWKEFLASPPPDQRCPDNATLVAIEART